MRNMATGCFRIFGRELGRFSSGESLRGGQICYSNMSAGKQRNSKPVEMSITKKLGNRFKPKHLSVINESYMHNVPKGSETHFKVVIVSEEFEAQPLITRHRMVNELLKPELENGVHALSIVAKTPRQWEEACKEVKPSPACRGGFGK